MLWAMIFTMVTEVLEQMIKIFPYADTDTVTAIGAYIGNFKTVVNAANYFIDIEMLFNYMGLVIGIEAIYWSFKIIRFVASSLPFSPLGGSR